MRLADFEGDPRAETALRYVVYALIAFGFGSCLLVGADQPADPALVPAPVTTAARAPAPPASVAP